MTGKKPEQPTHNYLKIILKLQAQGRFNPGLHAAEIAHDDWCKALTGGICNCNPDIKIVSRVPPA